VSPSLLYMMAARSLVDGLHAEADDLLAAVTFWQMTALEVVRVVGQERRHVGRPACTPSSHCIYRLSNCPAREAGQAGRMGSLHPHRRARADQALPRILCLQH
jgi:hypothetical protein